MKKPTADMIERVKDALAAAEAAGRRAANEYMRKAKKDHLGNIMDTCGFAHIYTEDCRSDVTAALRALGSVPRGRRNF